MVNDKKTLIVYYTQGGHTGKAIEQINETLTADTVKLAKYGKEGLEDNKFDPNEYDNIILAAPTHWWQVAKEMKKYLNEHKFSEKRLYLVLVCGGATLASKHNIKHRTKGNKIISTLKLRTLLSSEKKRTVKIEKWLSEVQLAN